MLQLTCRLVSRLIPATLACAFLVLTSSNASAQSAWSPQGDSGCSDQYGSFDAYIPGMRGFGSCNRGGFVPGTNVIVVTNTNATGSGSLDAASNAPCPKVILFGVSGIINRSGQVNFNCDGWSVVGASAPGQGITLTGATGNPNFAAQASDNFTVDHITVAPGDETIQSGGCCGNRDAIALVTGGTSNNGIFLNNNFIWGADETVQCYPEGSVDNILFWQNIIGRPVRGSGVHILQNTCHKHATIRNLYIHANGRMPLIRGDGYFHANNFTANPGYAAVNVQPCGGTYSPIDPTVRMNFIENLMARGANTLSGLDHIETTSSTDCTSVRVHESGNHTLSASFQIENCANHACLSGLSGAEIASSPVAFAYPSGYNPETIPNNVQGYIDFVAQVTTYVGAKPRNRLAFFDTLVNQANNHVDGSGERGNWQNGGPAGQPLDSVTEQGGISVVTPLRSSWDPTDGSENPCRENIPTGSTASAIQSSGLTRLHEWVIGCFYDYAMPGGYREDTLQNYPAPQGSGFIPPSPPPTLQAPPSPPSLLQVS